MKRNRVFLITAALLCLVALAFSACATAAGTTAGNTGTADPRTDGTPSADGATEPKKILVAYFSCTGNTRTAAQKLASMTGGDLYEILPAQPYSSADLNYSDSNCRANREMNDPASRPAMAGDAADMSAYDTILLGYPIWWGTMPRIINTFLDTYDLAGKTVLPFCTSGGTGIGTSVSAIRAAAPAAVVADGLRMSGASDSRITQWLSDNGLL